MEEQETTAEVTAQEAVRIWELSSFITVSTDPDIRGQSISYIDDKKSPVSWHIINKFGSKQDLSQVSHDNGLRNWQGWIRGGLLGLKPPLPN